MDGIDMQSTFSLLSFVALCVVLPTTLLFAMFMHPCSEIRTRLWCRRYGLKHREWTGPECATFWCGEDSQGRTFVPDGDGKPMEVRGTKPDKRHTR